MRRTGKKRAIRNAFYRLGLHSMTKGVVDALQEQGIQVDEERIRQVRFEMLKETTGEKISKITTLVLSPAVRCRPQGFPGRQANRLRQQEVKRRLWFSFYPKVSKWGE